MTNEERDALVNKAREALTMYQTSYSLSFIAEAKASSEALVAQLYDANVTSDDETLARAVKYSFTRVRREDLIRAKSAIDALLSAEDGSTS